MKDKRSNPAHRAAFDSTMAQIQRALESRCHEKSAGELEALAAQMTRLRLQRWANGVIQTGTRGA